MAKFIRTNEDYFINVDKIISCTVSYEWYKRDDFFVTKILFGKVLFTVDGIEDDVECQCDSFESPTNNEQQILESFYKWRADFDLKEFLSSMMVEL
jgi:hypothetical protein